MLPSPNGSTLSAVARRFGCEIVASCLRNARAVAARYADARVAVIAAGERWADGALRPAVEDLCGAGAVLSHFDRGRLSPEATAAVGAFGAAPDLRACISAIELLQRGYEPDVSLALALDASETVPVLTEGAYVATWT